MITSLVEDEKVDNFLDDGNVLVLTMNLESRKDGDIRIHLNNLPTPGQQNDKVIIFYKKKPDVITPENMHKVSHCLSVQSDPFSLSRIYSSPV